MPPFCFFFFFWPTNMQIRWRQYKTLNISSTWKRFRFFPLLSSKHTFCDHLKYLWIYSSDGKLVVINECAMILICIKISNSRDAALSSSLEQHIGRRTQNFRHCLYDEWMLETSQLKRIQMCFVCKVKTCENG